VGSIIRLEKFRPGADALPGNAEHPEPSWGDKWWAGLGDDDAYHPQAQGAIAPSRTGTTLDRRAGGCIHGWNREGYLSGGVLKAYKNVGIFGFECSFYTGLRCDNLCSITGKKQVGKKTAVATDAEVSIRCVERVQMSGAANLSVIYARELAHG